MLFHRDFGAAGKPPLVVLHGLLGSSRNWQAAGRDLAAGYHVFAPDLPHHGRSPHAGPANFEGMASAVLVWMDSLGLEKVSLMGHSMGGKVAMLLACRHPDRFERLIVVDIAPKDYVSLPHRAQFAALNELRVDTLRTRAEAELRLEARVPDLGARKFLCTNLECDDEGRWRWIINLPALTEGLADIERDALSPDDHYAGDTLFIMGGRSRYLDAGDLPAIERHFPAVRLEVIPESGHNPHMDAREQFVALVLGDKKGP